MPRKMMPADHIEMFFRTATAEEVLIQRERIDLILRCRGIGEVPKKRGRPRTKKAKGPLVADGGAA